MKLYTIGFTRRSARDFFGTLKTAGVKRLVDVRLNNTSQLAGFTKRDDLEFFAGAVCGIPYEHRLELAPVKEILDPYRKDKREWAEYEGQFRKLIIERGIEKTLERESLDGACLLCSEDKPHHCHRRLVAEHLRDAWGGVEIAHL